MMEGDRGSGKKERERGEIKEILFLLRKTEFRFDGIQDEKDKSLSGDLHRI